ncbi:hypothetical protein GOB40_13685 [Sinorhizobium meliloti]|nr:hypothetical protein [Sinorhizobium meliloti]
MGCDIHFYVEKKVDGQWVTADKWTQDEYDDDGVLHVDYKEAYYSGRSYNLFAILADVRNGRGFAGVKTGEGFNPIAEPRGVPEDACAEYRANVERYGCDGHSHSYFTLAELLAYDWTQTTKQQGWVNPLEWARWRDYGKPNGWCGDIGGGNVRHLTNEEFEAAWQKIRIENGYPENRYASAHLTRHQEDGGDVARMKELLGGSPYTLVTWTEPYYEAISGDFFSKAIPRLLKLASDAGGIENVRAVFYFDN